MAIAYPVEPITLDDEALRRALEDAFLPALLPALAQVTGDMSILSDDLRPPAILAGRVRPLIPRRWAGRTGLRASGLWRLGGSR